ncbi:MAG: DUF1194 domain-containing protein [Alphaproteobacteria bacterium]
MKYVFLSLIAGLALIASPVEAQRKTSVDLELSFVVDASGSIDEDEMRLQRQGYASALVNPDVLKAIDSGFLRSIAVSYIEFAADGCIWQWLKWVKVSDRASAETAGATIMAAPREFCSGGNAIGDAVAFATKSTLENNFDGTHKVIDVSGDGPDTTGLIAVEDARADALAKGFTINGLVIERPAMPDLPEYYKRSITGGPRSFVIQAKDRRSFADAIVKKLILEIADRVPDRQQATNKD